MTTPELLYKILEAVKAKKFQEVTKVAHQLKSSSGNVGAQKFSKLCGELECFSKWDDSSAIAELFESLNLEFSAVQCALQAELAQG